MNEERKGFIYMAVFLNSVMTALAVVAFTISLWLLASGRLFSEGVDATFLFAVGIVSGCVFASVPLLSIRDGLLRDVREMLESAPQAAAAPRRKRARAWRESPAH